MTDDATSDEVYQPAGDGDVQDDVGPLDPEDTLDDRGVDEALDEGYAPPEHPLAVNRYGITGDEQHRGESLDQLLSEEVPDDLEAGGDGVGDAWDTDGELIDGEVGDRRAGRLVAPGEGSHAEHDGMVASDEGIDGAGASAEEAAMHVVPDEEW